MYKIAYSSRIGRRGELWDAGFRAHDWAAALPGADEPLRFEALKYPPGFQVLTWAGSISASEALASYYIDNLRLAKDPK